MIEMGYKTIIYQLFDCIFSLKTATCACSFLQVLLLARLHHRNLVNLIGYCVDKGQHMLVYEFLSNGSLDSFLYGKSRFLHLNNGN